jgi:hypothetical protein
MMKNDKRKNSTAKKLLPAAMMLAVSASMLGTSTYAWFTMNKEATVTGMQLKTKVSSNLLVSATNSEDGFAKVLTQERCALLEPVSTIDGKAFFYTVKAKADGDAYEEDYTTYSESTSLSTGSAKAAKTQYDSTFNSRYGISTANTAGDYSTAFGYVDYSFYLKATNTGDQDGEIDLTKCELLYDDDGDSTTDPVAVTDKAWRVAMFVQDLSTEDAGVQTATGAGVTGSALTEDVTTIMTINGAANQTAGDSTSYKAVDSGTTLDDVTYNTAAIVDDALPESLTRYYQIVVRVWLEGEDTTCTSETYANLTEAYSLELEFSLDGGDAGDKVAISKINQAQA